MKKRVKTEYVVPATIVSHFCPEGLISSSAVVQTNSWEDETLWDDSLIQK